MMKRTHVFAETGKTYTYWVFFNSPVPKWFGVAVITIFCFVCVAGKVLSREDHAHEFRHIVQWFVYWFLFWFYYLRALFIKGYTADWAEREAVLFSLAHFMEFDDLEAPA